MKRRSEAGRRGLPSRSTEVEDDMDGPVDSDSGLSDDFAGEDSEEDADGDRHADSGSHPTEGGDNGPPVKRSKLSKAELYKPPTNEEMHQLRETENLFHSNLFRLQIEELLKEVKLKDTRRKLMDPYLHKLKDVLLGLPSQDEREIVDQKWLKAEKVCIPLIQEPYKVKGKFSFHPPRSVKVIGSYLLGTCVRPDIHVDLLMELPKECIQPKDYLNHRYLRKRALYLSMVVTLLRGSDLVDELMFTYHHGNHMKPILVVKPPGKLGQHIKVHLHTSAELSTFKLNRFHICKNNVRRAWYADSTVQEETNEGLSAEPATPHYNTSILHDLTLQQNLAVAHDALTNTNVKEGISLLKVWLHQRQLDKGYGGFSGFILTMYAVYLLQQRKLGSTMSCYQIIRIMLITLSQLDWTKQGIALATDEADSQRPHISDFQEAFDVVFVDSSGYVNLCAAMSKFTFQRVQHEAKLSLMAIDSVGLDGFQSLFMKSLPFVQKFDQLIHISKLEKLNNAKVCLEDKLLDHGGNYMAVGVAKLLQVLDEGIGSRIRMLAVQLKPSPQWSVNTFQRKFSQKEHLTFGILVNPDTAGSIIDRGPAADSPEAAAFREFWGEKSELRRFQDGMICEAVVWPCQSIADRRLILMHALKHALHRHAAIPNNTVTFIGSQLECVLRYPVTTVSYGTGEEQHTSILQVYDGLCRNLRKLQNLPLTIHSIQGTSPAFRYADVFPTLPVSSQDLVYKDGNRIVPVKMKECPAYMPSMTVQCVLEMSGKWPEDLQAVRRLKAAFHVQLSEALSAEHNLISCAYPDHVLVLKGGYVFRVQIGYLKEIVLLRMVNAPTGMRKMVDTEESLSLETQLVTLPKLATALHGLQQQHPSYSSAVRLAKRWVASHLMFDQVSEEALELLTAHVYLHPAPFTPPGSPQVGFLRFLNLLSTHDWQSAPLIVNLNRELKKEDFADIQSRFNRDRATLPLMFIATSYNKTTSVWSKRKPTALVLNRLVMIAQESLKVAQAQLSDTNVSLDFKQIFRTPLDAFDVLIHLKTSVLPRKHLAVDLPQKPGDESKAGDVENAAMPVVNFDPAVLYIKELREAFQHVALFFYDHLGGACVAVLWKPSTLEPQPFKVSHINASMVDTEASGKDVKLKPNINTILTDFMVIGDGIVSDVEVISDRLPK